MDATPKSNGDRMSTHNSVINRNGIKAALRGAGLRCSTDLILTLEARVNVMIRQAIRGMGGLKEKTVKGEHIERGAMRAEPNGHDPAALVAALKGMVDLYVALVNSGDAGVWNPEMDVPVIAARKVLPKKVAARKVRRGLTGKGAR